MTRTFVVRLPKRSTKQVRRPARIYDKNDNVVFEGSNATAQLVWGKMLKASGALAPPTPEEAELLKRDKRRRRFWRDY